MRTICLVLALLLLCCPPALTAGADDRQAEELVDAFNATTASYLYGPGRDRGLTDLAEALRVLGEPRLFRVLEDAHAVARERRDYGLARRVIELADFLYDPRNPIDLSDDGGGSRLVLLDGIVVAVQPDSTGGSVPASEWLFEHPPSSFVDRERGLAEAPKRAPLDLIRRLGGKPDNPRLAAVLGCQTGRNSLATELGLAAGRSDAVAAALLRLAPDLPRPSSLATVVDLAIGVSQRKDAREFLAKNLAGEAKVVRSGGDIAAFVGLAVALDLGGGEAEVVAALGRIGENSIRRAIDLAGEVGGNAGTNYLATQVFSRPDPLHIKLLRDACAGPMRHREPERYLGLVRQMLDFIEKTPEIGAGLRAEVPEALDAMLFLPVGPDTASFASELLAAVDDGGLKLIAEKSGEWGAFGPYRVFQTDPRVQRAPAEGAGGKRAGIGIRAKRTGTSIRIEVHNTLSRPLYVNRFSMTHARGSRMRQGRLTVMQVDLGLPGPFILDVSPAWIDVIEPGGKQVYDLPLGQDFLNCDVFEIHLRERCEFPSLTKDDALLSRFRVRGR